MQPAERDSECLRSVTLMPSLGMAHVPVFDELTQKEAFMSTLRQRMIDVMRIRNLSVGTQEEYLRSVNDLARHCDRRPDRISHEQVQAYVLYLLDQRNLARSTVNVRVGGIRFFYSYVLGHKDVDIWMPRGKEPQKLPEVPSHPEVGKLLEVTTNPKHRAVLTTAYAAGLRSSELRKLKVSDVDGDRMVIRIEQGKRYKDRYTILSRSLRTQLRAYWALERPSLYLFPGALPDEPMSRGTPGQIYRKARRLARHTKKGGIHSLRHAFATHLVEAGVEPHVVQMLLGHGSIKTTMRYVRIARPKAGAIEDLLTLLPPSAKIAEQVTRKRRR